MSLHQLTVLAASSPLQRWPICWHLVCVQQLVCPSGRLPYPLVDLRTRRWWPSARLDVLWVRKPSPPLVPPLCSMLQRSVLWFEPLHLVSSLGSCRQPWQHMAVSANRSAGSLQMSKVTPSHEHPQPALGIFNSPPALILHQPKPCVLPP